MSEPIKEGDLVVVVRPSSCGCRDDLGKIFKVDSIEDATEHYSTWGCPGCGIGGALPVPALYAQSDEDNAANEYGVGLARIRRIPPLEELEGVKSEEKLREPA